MGNTEQEQAEAMKRYIREVFISEYAKNFNKGLSAEDIKFYGKIHFNRDRSSNKLNMHCHLIVSRKDQSNKVKISPLTNHRNTKKGAIKGGFDRVTLFENVEKGFDKLFGYNRQLSETFEYCNTMKNGSIEDQLKMQECEINTSVQQHDSNPEQKQTDSSIKQSVNPTTNISDLGLSSALGIFTIEPNSEEPKQPTIPKKKKKKPKRGLKR